MEGQEQNPANSTANGPAQVGEMPLLTELEVSIDMALPNGAFCEGIGSIDMVLPNGAFCEGIGSIDMALSNGAFCEGIGSIDMALPNGAFCEGIGSNSHG